MTWGITQQRYTKFFFVWAGIIAFAQIYVGVHYPLDIVGGAIIGLVSGFAMAKVYLKLEGPMLFKQAYRD
jgi:undecaprenyl-diphosphatase